MVDPSKLGTIENVRGDAYRKQFEETIMRGVCIFCKLDASINVVRWESAHWHGWFNPRGYDHHQYHIIIATKEHLTELHELSPEMFRELGELVQSICTELNIVGGGIVMRFGDSKLSASTLRHLHVHIQVPDGSGPAFAVFCGKDFELKKGS